MKALKWTLFGLGGLLVLALVFIVWVLNSQSGARWAAARAGNMMGDKLEIGGVEGAIAGPLTLSTIRWRDPAAGLDVALERVALDVALLDLFRMVVHVKDAELSGVNVLLSEPTQPAEPPAPSEPFSLEPPIDIVIDAFNASDVAVRRESEVLLAITTAAFAGRWTADELAVETLDVQSPQGEIYFAGRAAQGEVYTGEGDGRFRWQAGEQTYAGSLQTVAEGGDVNLGMTLTRPLNAQLDLFLQQTDATPWRFQLEAPRFDPREEFLPDSSFTSLAASLHGEGTLKKGAVAGELLINGETLHLDPVRFARDEHRVSLESLLRIGDTAGELRAEGVIVMSEDEEAPWNADIDARWRDLIVPAPWAGQELHTRGELAFDGDPQAYTAKGALTLGPPERTADIEFHVEGAPEVVQLTQFDIVQENGRLNASGKIDLQPALAWNIAAEGRQFDPGAFAVSWPGRLNFTLASDGRMTQEGPAATVQLNDLNGELRGRRLTGTADLALTPPLLIAGDLGLRSGDSTVEFHGAPGEAIDGTLAIDIASLNDWAPNARGELTGNFGLRGRWPELSINGEASGKGIEAADVHIDAFTLSAEVDEPLNPRGAARLDLTRLVAMGFEFDAVNVNASGAPEAHELAFTASGEPLALELNVKGGRTDAGWSGSLQQLVIDVQDAARLALREPVEIVLADGAVDVSQACLTDGDIELCARGATEADGALQASYSLAGVPLALANAFTSTDLPLRFAGVIEGRGDIRRTSDGALFGDAQIRSPSGGVSRVMSEAEEGGDAEETQTLMSYNDLMIAANLSGSDARASVSARLDEQGSIDGEATLQGLGEAETGVVGRFNASIPDIAPLAVFAPQIANVQGRVDARASISGTLQAPQITGEVNAADLAADIPDVGLHLKNGVVQIRPLSGGDFEIAGGVDSGEGRLEFAGRASPTGAVELSVNGDQFLAADIPGANVIITPDLNFVRADERMTLKGEVTIPHADVNLQKLPRGERVQKASSDVVVIDDEVQEEDAEQMPLHANITIILGDDVNLTGFGLIAKVDGRLAVVESPGDPTTASGEVRVSGTYKAYGQDLTIQQGQLLFAGSPIDNPRLNIEATREVGEVTAGLRVRGSAQSPELTVFSDPAMAQSNALSYLVAGKPLDDIGSGEGDALQTASRSLGTAAGGLLAKNIGKRLGVDEFAVKDDEMIGGAALTVGEYLSPRLYLSYGVGLFEPGDVVTLLYELTENLSAKAQRGPEDSRVGLEWRMER